MSEREDKKKPRKPRQSWDRKPIQRAHSTPKGGRGYDRHREKENFRKDLENLEELEDQEDQGEIGDLEDQEEWDNNDDNDDYEDRDERDDY